MSAGFEVVLRCDVEAAGAARRAIAENYLTLPRSLREDMALLVTELVTNAVRHGDAAGDRPITVEVRHQDDRIRVDVLDPGSDFDPPSVARNGDSSGGWGLFLVDQIAERWGVSPASAGTCVWFELPSAATA